MRKRRFFERFHSEAEVAGGLLFLRSMLGYPSAPLLAGAVVWLLVVRAWVPAALLAVFMWVPYPLLGKLSAAGVLVYCLLVRLYGPAIVLALAFVLGFRVWYAARHEWLEAAAGFELEKQGRFNGVQELGDVGLELRTRRKRALINAAVDAETCIGCGVCEETCPEVFKLNNDDIAEVINATPSPDLEEKVREAAEACPVDAITL